MFLIIFRLLSRLSISGFCNFNRRFFSCLFLLLFGFCAYLCVRVMRKP